MQETIDNAAEKEVVFQLTLPSKDHTEFKLAAVRNGVLMKDFALDAIREKIARLGEKTDLT